MRFKTDSRINEIFLSREAIILRVVNDLNPNKAHGCDGLSIKMIKMCGNAIVTPLRRISTRRISSRIRGQNVWVLTQRFNGKYIFGHLGD